MSQIVCDEFVEYPVDLVTVERDGHQRIAHIVHRSQKRLLNAGLDGGARPADPEPATIAQHWRQGRHEPARALLAPPVPVDVRKDHRMPSLKPRHTPNIIDIS